jgi:hypothetical protein
VNDTNIIQYSREALISELAFRRESRRRVFSWCSSILVAAIGVKVALTHEGHLLSRSHQWVVTLTIVTLAAFTLLWVNHHRKIENNIQKEIHWIERMLQMITVKIEIPFLWMQNVAIVLLALWGLLAIWEREICQSISIALLCGPPTLPTR